MQKLSCFEVLFLNGFCSYSAVHPTALLDLVYRLSFHPNISHNESKIGIHLVALPVRYSPLFYQTFV